MSTEKPPLTTNYECLDPFQCRVLIFMFMSVFGISRCSLRF